MARKLAPAGKKTTKRPLSPYEKIKTAISDGTFPPGNALVESSVAEWCGVSRTPVREALTRLLQDGLVAKTDRGMVVRERTPEEILDIYETRIVLEAAAARLAAERHGLIDRVRLERLMRLAEETDSSASAIAERNRDFHAALWAASHNESLIDVLTRLNLHLARYPTTTLAAPGRWVQSLEEHRELVAAVIDRNPELAEKLAKVHFSAARDIRLAQWEDSIG
jgi:DNA-binding GntR family transcriptional regulator